MISVGPNLYFFSHFVVFYECFLLFPNTVMQSPLPGLQQTCLLLPLCLHMLLSSLCVGGHVLTQITFPVKLFPTVMAFKVLNTFTLVYYFIHCVMSAMDPNLGPMVALLNSAGLVSEGLLQDGHRSFDCSNLHLLYIWATWYSLEVLFEVLLDHSCCPHHHRYYFNSF